ncbi:secreted protein [Micromonospora sp. M42]|nr:secreted protein [Micromonospora sp. M42]
MPCSPWPPDCPARPRRPRTHPPPCRLAPARPTPNAGPSTSPSPVATTSTSPGVPAASGWPIPAPPPAPARPPWRSGRRGHPALRAARPGPARHPGTRPANRPHRRRGYGGGPGARLARPGLDRVARRRRGRVRRTGPPGAGARRADHPGRRSEATVTGLTLAADSAATTAVQPAAPLTYRVYATRIGLVGGTTANGHTVRARDHFAALPSRRGLSPRGTGDYTVKVCTTSGGRCEYAPVWDVGPWNTRDDWWNPSSIRENWKDLPRGRPEAQAAYQSNYNGGLDQFGRTVRNPAGLDLADGTFWDGLRLTDNAWVDVTLLWTGGGARAVVGSGPLNLRAGAGTSYASRGLAATYAQVPVQCYVTGQKITGTYRTTTRWYRLVGGTYVSHAYLSSIYGGTVPRC